MQYIRMNKSPGYQAEKSAEGRYGHWWIKLEASRIKGILRGIEYGVYFKEFFLFGAIYGINWLVHPQNMNLHQVHPEYILRKNSII